MTERNLERGGGQGLRAFDPRRDLVALADLIEVAFGAENDQDVAEIARDLRWLASTRWLVWLLNALSGDSSPLMRGMVWTEDGRLVGNVTLTLEDKKRGLWAISNVAVHPDYQRRGIARRLVEAALADAKRRGARLVILQVRTDNATAQRLYAEHGFTTYDTVADLRLLRAHWVNYPMPAIEGLRPREAEDAGRLLALWETTTPQRAQMVRGTPFRLAGPLHRVWARWTDGMFTGVRKAEYVVERQGEIVAWLRARPRYLGPHRLRVEVHPQARGAGLELCLVHAGLALLASAPEHDVLVAVSTGHPEALQAFLASGFHTDRVLQQMALELGDQAHPAAGKGEIAKEETDGLARRTNADSQDD